MAADDDSPFDFGRDAKDLLRRLEPQLEALFEEYRLSPAEADDVLEASLTVLGLASGRVHNPEEWFLATVRGRCRQVAEERLHRFDGPEH